MSDYVLQVKSLHKFYGERCVVKDVGFSIRPGECFGLLGHNGAGKSTTLECILQVRKADQGAVTLLGQELHKKDTRLFRQIGVQFQESCYPDKMKVKEACCLTGAMYGMDSEWDGLLKDFQLDTFRNHYINELSGGERQRLSVLLAMLPRPRILFLDELTTGLDAQARRSIWGYIQAYKEKGNSLLLTSHYMDEVEVLCDSIGILKNGSFLFKGNVEEAKRATGSSTLEEAYLKLNEEH